MKQALGWLLVATLALTVPYAARAVEDEDTGTQGTGRVDEPQVPVLWKLGRGLQNAAWGLPAEIVKNTLSEAFKSDTAFGFGSGIFEGVLVGIGKGFWRVGAGVCDIVTFPAARLAPWYNEYLPPYPF